jgi:hypothetical protein
VTGKKQMEFHHVKVNLTPNIYKIHLKQFGSFFLKFLAYSLLVHLFNKFFQPRYFASTVPELLQRRASKPADDSLASRLLKRQHKEAEALPLAFYRYLH